MQILTSLQVMPGDNVEMVLDLITEVAAEVGLRFTLREGGRTGTPFFAFLCELGIDIL